MELEPMDICTEEAPSQQSPTTVTGTFSNFALKVLYLFAGSARKGDIKQYFTLLATEHFANISFTEVDLLRGGASHDLSLEDRQQQYLDSLKDFHIVIVTPPCSSHSRAQWANPFGCLIKTALRLSCTTL